MGGEVILVNSRAFPATVCKFNLRFFKFNLIQTNIFLPYVIKVSQCTNVKNKRCLKFVRFYSPHVSTFIYSHNQFLDNIC